MEIVRMTVDHHRPPNNLFGSKPFCQNRKVGSAIAAQQRRKIPCMTWMLRLTGIIMSACIGKALSPAVSALMDMKSVKARFGVRQTADIRDHHRSFPVLIKPYRSGYARAPFPADAGSGIGKPKLCVHMITSFYYIRTQVKQFQISQKKLLDRIPNQCYNIARGE